jgi:hypothetical protein
VLVYDGGKHGIAAAATLFENPRTGLKPIGFLDDDPGRTGWLVNGLPVLGRSYELESLSVAHGVKAVLVASPVVPLDRLARITTTCERLGIGLFRLEVQLEQLLKEVPLAGGPELASLTMASIGTSTATAIPAAIPASVQGLESEPCGRCGGLNVHRSRAKSVFERFRKLHTPTRPFRCDDCGWRGWRLPLERAMPLDQILEADLQSLDTAFLPLPALGDGNHGGNAQS